MQNLLKRAAVTFTLGPLVLLLIYLGSWFYFLPFVALLGLATIEYSHLLAKLGRKVPLGLLLPLVFLQWFFPLPVQEMLFGDRGINTDFTAAGLLIGLLAAMVYALWLFEKRTEEDAPGSWLATMGGLLLLGWLGSYFFRVRGLPENAVQWTALAMLGTWIADSGAYVFGKTLGKHKLSPRLSPNKTLEGYAGGIIAGTISAVIIGRLMGLPFNLVLGLGLLVSVVSPAGDLGVSLLKRSAGVKDSGHFLPGHGGALDRIDTLLWSLAMTYFLIVFST